jgi:hypothetical protein
MTTHLYKLPTTRHPADNVDHDSLKSTEGCTNTATLGTNATNDFSVVIRMTNHFVEVGTARRPNSLKVNLLSPPKP